MKLLAIDIGRKTGWAAGDSAAHPPRVGVVDLGRGASPEAMAGAFARWLRDMIKADRPDKIIVENFMRPAASENEDATVAQILLHGALHGVAGMARIEVVAVGVSTVRTHFCGQATALPRSPRGHKRSHAEKREARRANKRMVETRAKQLGYLPRDFAVGISDDRNEADACAVFDWGKAHVARVAPRELVMFQNLGEENGRSQTRQRMVS